MICGRCEKGISDDAICTCNHPQIMHLERISAAMIEIAFVARRFLEIKEWQMQTPQTEKKSVIDNN